jgi:predicted nucleotidyltransferase
MTFIGVGDARADSGTAGLGTSNGLNPCVFASVYGECADVRAARIRGVRPRARDLAAAGVRARIVGSLAYGAVRPDSDLDLLVLAHPGRSWAEVQSIASGAARPYGVPVDVIFADTLPAAVRRAMLKDARRAGDL